MKRFSTTLALLVLVLLAVAAAITIRSRLVQNGSSDSRQAAQAATEKVAFKVDGMTCGGCAIGVKKTLEKQNGVRKAEVFLSPGLAERPLPATLVPQVSAGPLLRPLRQKR